MYLGGAVFVGLLVAGCASTGLPRCPKQGGPPWRAVESEHFTIYTDASSTKAASVAADLEFTRGALAHLLVPEWDGPAGRIPVVLLEGEGHFETFFQDGIVGLYTELFLQPLVVMDGASGISAQVLIKHELTHFLVDGYISLEHMPRWVGEGLATFFETMDVDRAGGRVTVGKSVDDRVVFALAKYYPQRIMMQYRVEMLQSGDGAFYGQSWLKVHFLVNHHGPAFAAFLDGLHRGKSEDEAWREAFPDLPQDRLEEHLTAYVTDGKYRVTTLRVPTYPYKISERAVDDADVHGWRAALYAVRSKVKDERGEKARVTARAEVAEARKEDPAHVMALGAEFLLDDGVTVEKARLATTTHAESWLGWFLLAEAMRKGGDDKAAWEAVKEALRRTEANPAIWLKDKLKGIDRPTPGHG